MFSDIQYYVEWAKNLREQRNDIGLYKTQSTPTTYFTTKNWNFHKNIKEKGVKRLNPISLNKVWYIMYTNVNADYQCIDIVIPISEWSILSE